MEICQFWDREFMSLNQKYEERVRKFFFLARHYVKAELYRYIYIVSVRIILDCISVFLDPQCIVSQEDFQHKTLNRSTLLPLLSLHTSRSGKREQEL